MSDWKEIIQKAIYRDFPDSEVVDFEETSGLAHKVFVVELDNPERKVVANFCHREELEDRFEVEPEVTRLVERKTDVNVPHIIRSDLSKEFVPQMYYLSGLVPGYNPGDRFKHMAVWKKKRILRQAGRLLGRVHSQVGFDRPGHLRFDHDRGELETYGPDKWVEIFKEVMYYQLDNAHERFSDIVPELKRVFEDNLHLIEGDFQPVLLHQDYGPRNIHVEGSNVSGILDWERALAGHSEYDLFKAEIRFVYLFQSENLKEKYRRHFYKGYRELNSFEDGWKKRRTFYRYSCLFEPLWTFDPEKYSDPDGREKELRDLIEMYFEELD